MQTLTPPSDAPPLDADAATPPKESRFAREMRQAMIDPSAPEQNSPLTHSGADRVREFAPLIAAIRMATAGLSALVASSDLGARDTRVTIGLAVVVIYALIRTVRPITYESDIRSLLRVLVEVSIHVAIVAATGWWDSPLVYSLVTAVMVAGFARGVAFALRIGITTALMVSLPYMTANNNSPEALRIAATWSALILLIALLAGYGRRVSGEADRERELALDRLTRLSDANTLLYSLHHVAQSLPASLDMEDVLDSTVTRLRTLLPVDTFAVLLFDESSGQFDVVRQEGLMIARHVTAGQLPPAVQQALVADGVILEDELQGPVNPGLSNRSGSGLYAPLKARDSMTGVLVVENGDQSAYDTRSVEILDGFVEPLALALDNARWFSRLRTVGADEERTRIARDLHDRIGQSLAYLAFELDRITGRQASGEDLGDSLDQLREDVRGVIKEVRDTLYDLRTDVSDTSPLGEILDEYAERVADRTSLRIEVDADRDHRLPILQEREMWRIAQEAITNIERHASASVVRIIWRCDGQRAAIRVTDDGEGFKIGDAGRLDSYGMMGMRERASSIGANLDIQSVQGQGTSITCVLDPTKEQRS